MPLLGSQNFVFVRIAGPSEIRFAVPAEISRDKLFIRKLHSQATTTRSRLREIRMSDSVGGWKVTSLGYTTLF